VCGPERLCVSSCVLSVCERVFLCECVNMCESV
jgi:hypothetical protein